MVSFGAHLSAQRSTTDWASAVLITVYVSFDGGSLVGLTSRLLHTDTVNVANVVAARCLLSTVGVELLDGLIPLACCTDYFSNSIASFQPNDPNGNIRSMKPLQQSFPNPNIQTVQPVSFFKPPQRRVNNNNSMSLSMDNAQLKDALWARNNCR